MACSPSPGDDESRHPKQYSQIAPGCLRLPAQGLGSAITLRIWFYVDGNRDRKPTVVFQDRIDAALGERTIDHLVDSFLPVEVRIDGESYAVTVRVYYSNHCWTRTRKDEPEDAILFYEHHSDWVDERVFCATRWEFSLQLPEIVASLSHSLCLPGRSKEIFYRVKADKTKGDHAGWYMCARLDAIQSKEEITLSIRSVHYRTNRPEDTRGGPQRFWALFWDFYKDLRAKHDWVVAGETKINPPA